MILNFDLTEVHVYNPCYKMVTILTCWSLCHFFFWPNLNVLHGIVIEGSEDDKGMRQLRDEW